MRLLIFVVVATDCPPPSTPTPTFALFTLHCHRNGIPEPP